MGPLGPAAHGRSYGAVAAAWPSCRGTPPCPPTGCGCRKTGTHPSVAPCLCTIWCDKYTWAAFLPPVVMRPRPCLAHTQSCYVLVWVGAVTFYLVRPRARHAPICVDLPPSTWGCCIVALHTAPFGARRHGPGKGDNHGKRNECKQVNTIGGRGAARATGAGVPQRAAPRRLARRSKHSRFTSCSRCCRC